MNWIFPAIIENITSRKDRTWKVTISTNELSPDNILKLGQSLNNFGYLAFKEDAFKTSEINAIDNLKADYEDKGKSPSQRFRGVLWHYWKQNNNGYEDFEKFYEFEYEKIINHFKNKLT